MNFLGFFLLFLSLLNVSFVQSLSEDVVQLREHFITNLLEEHRENFQQKLTEEIQQKINERIEAFMRLINNPPVRKRRDMSQPSVNDKRKLTIHKKILYFLILEINFTTARASFKPKQFFLHISRLMSVEILKELT
jgi:hypothetical protein